MPSEITQEETWQLPVSSWDNWPGDLLVIIPCSKGKRDHPAPASQLYTGPMFTMALRAARVLVPDEQIRVLSALHGWVELDQVIEPYDWKMARNARGAVLASTGSPGLYDGPPYPMPLVLEAQAREQGILDAEYVLSLCPHDYWEPVRRCWGHRAINAFYGCRGIGDQRHELAEIAAMGHRLGVA